MLKSIKNSEETLIYLIINHSLAPVAVIWRTRNMNQPVSTCVLAFHSALAFCHSRKCAGWMLRSLSVLQELRGVEVRLWSQQSHRLALGLLSCSSKIPLYFSTGYWGKCWQLQLVVLQSLLLLCIEKLKFMGTREVLETKSGSLEALFWASHFWQVGLAGLWCVPAPGKVET